MLTPYQQHDRCPEDIDIARASLDDPDAVAPRDHTFASERLRSMDGLDVLPAYPRTRSGGLG